MFVINGRFCNFVTKFNVYDEESKTEYFRYCIKLNNWDKTDIILAVHDYYDHDVYKYENNSIIVYNCDKDRFLLLDS
jgi:hypothetical protein